MYNTGQQGTPSPRGSSAPPPRVPPYEGPSPSSPTTCKSSCFDSSNDSGFVSASNLASTSSMCEDLYHSRPLEESAPSTSKTRPIDPTDSGIDISEQMSSLQLAPDSLGPHHISCDSGGLKDEPDSETRAGGANGSRKGLAMFGISPNHIAVLREIFHFDEDGDTQLHIAVMRGFVEIVWNLTRIIPHQALLDLPNNTNRTSLHLAVSGGDARVARHLVVCGASPLARDRRGNTPLHVACALGDAQVVTQLTKPVLQSEVLNSGLLYMPVHTSGLLPADLNNYDGQTCIHIAAKGGHKHILLHLSYYGADMNAKEAKSGRTALHLAVEARDADLVAFLVKQCRADPQQETYGGLTPYQLALANDVPAIASLLVKLGAHIDPLPLDNQDDEFDNEEVGLDCVDNEWTPAPVMEDLRVLGVPATMPVPVPVSSHSPFNADLYL